MATRWSSSPKARAATRASRSRSRAGCTTWPMQFPQVQLIPAWIDNVQRVMPKGEVVPVPILCTVTFGAPLAAASRRGQARLPRSRARRPCSRLEAARHMSCDRLRGSGRQRTGRACCSSILFGVLVLAIGRPIRCTRCASATRRATRHASFKRDLRAVWVGTVLFWLAWLSGPVGATLLFGVFSFLALREFITPDAHPAQRPPQPDPGLLRRAAGAVRDRRHRGTSTCSRCSSRSTCSSRSRWSARWPATRSAFSSATPRSSGASWSASTA